MIAISFYEDLHSMVMKIQALMLMMIQTLI